MTSNGGLLIVLEGVEGVGKTTQWTRLADVLHSADHDVVALREPGGTKTGDVVRQLVLGTENTLSDVGEALLFASSRAEIIAQVIQPSLERGAIVLLDRFLLSTYAYQGAGRALDLETLKLVNQFATRNIRPDLTLLLTMPLEEALARAHARSSSDRIEREDRSFHHRVATAFLNAASADWQQAHPECGPIVVVDAREGVDVVTGRCVQHLKARWPKRFDSLA